MLATDTHVHTQPKPQVLICDDDAVFSAELVEALHMRGYCASALLTLTSIRAAIVSPKFLLLDVCMPQPDGFEILKMLATHERKEHFRIVMISGGDDNLLAAAGRFCESNGLRFVGTMRKPIAIRELCDMIEVAYD
ncbi:MAG TPA: response regulator [Rhizomicrobium sp.]|nr:response regulator [Rhizomicrobium sp.]